MSSVSNTPKTTVSGALPAQKHSFFFSILHLPRNIYLLLLFTTGKGFQLTISALTLVYYIHSLGYQPEFIGLFSAMPAIGALIGAVPIGRLADRIGRRRVLIATVLSDAVFGTLSIFAPSFAILLVLRFLTGAAVGAFRLRLGSARFSTNNVGPRAQVAAEERRGGSMRYGDRSAAGRGTGPTRRIVPPARPVERDYGVCETCWQSRTAAGSCGCDD